MDSHLPVASRTKASTKKEDSFAGGFSNVEPGGSKGGSSGATRAVCDRGARQRVSSVSGGLGGGGGAGDDSREVIVITDSEEDSDKVISVRGSGEEEEESTNYGAQTARRFEPNFVFEKCKNAVIVDDVSSDSDEEEGTHFEFDESGGGHENGMSGGEEFLSNACSDDELIRSGEEKVFGEQGEGNGRSFKSKNDDYAPNVSRRRTPAATEDGPEADLSLDYLSSSSESSTEADDSGDENFVANVSESLSADGETSSSSEECVCERGKKRC